MKVGALVHVCVSKLGSQLPSTLAGVCLIIPPRCPSQIKLPSLKAFNIGTSLILTFVSGVKCAVQLALFILICTCILSIAHLHT